VPVLPKGKAVPDEGNTRIRGNARDGSLSRPSCSASLVSARWDDQSGEGLKLIRFFPRIQEVTFVVATSATVAFLHDEFRGAKFSFAPWHLRFDMPGIAN
jgi:hypothetical protein